MKRRTDERDGAHESTRTNTARCRRFDILSTKHRTLSSSRRLPAGDSRTPAQQSVLGERRRGATHRRDPVREPTAHRFCTAATRCGRSLSSPLFSASDWRLKPPARIFWERHLAQGVVQC